MEFNIFKKPYNVMTAGTCLSYTEISSPIDADVLLLSLRCYNEGDFLEGEFRQFLREVSPVNKKFYIRKENEKFAFYDCDIVGYKNFPNKI